MNNKGKKWHPSKVLYTFLEHSPFAGAFFQKTVKYFWAHLKDAEKVTLKHLSTDCKKLLNKTDIKYQFIIVEKIYDPRYYVMANTNNFYKGETSIGRSILLEKDELSPVRP